MSFKKDVLDADETDSDWEEDVDAEDSETETLKDMGLEGTSAPETVFLIVKNIVGEGMLSLPYGVASGTGLIISIGLATVFGVALSYTFSLMGRVCHFCQGKTHKDCADKVTSPWFGTFMAVILMCKTALTCTSYAIVIGDSGHEIAKAFGWEVSKQLALIVVMVVVLLPLVLQKNLGLIAKCAMFGIVCEFFVVAVMQYRALDGTYKPGGKYYVTLDADVLPDFSGGVNLWGVEISSFVFLGTLSTAFIAHYNSPKFYSNMRVRTIRRFSKVVPAAFACAYVIYVWIMCVGYLTFGKNCNGDILLNYSHKDPGATAARVAIGIAVIFGFPLSFAALRDSTLSVFGIYDERKRIFIFTTFVLLIPVLSLALMGVNLGLLNSVGGSIFGSLIVWVFPAFLCIYTAKHIAHSFKRREASMNWAIIAVGVVILGFGTTVNFLKTCAPWVLGKDGDGKCWMEKPSAVAALLQQRAALVAELAGIDFR